MMVRRKEKAVAAAVVATPAPPEAYVIELTTLFKINGLRMPTPLASTRQSAAFKKWPLASLWKTNGVKNSRTVRRLTLDNRLVNIFANEVERMELTLVFGNSEQWVGHPQFRRPSLECFAGSFGLDQEEVLCHRSACSTGMLQFCSSLILGALRRCLARPC